MREIEIEFKNLLTKDQYASLFEKYDLKNSEEIIKKISTMMMQMKVSKKSEQH